MKKTAVVVIPTYNEAGQTAEMIDTLMKDIFPKIEGWNMVLLYVDGNSPDGTPDIIRDKQKEYGNLDLIVEKKKEGIGAAYVKGFRRAMKDYNADVVIEFDSDFQHPPDRIPALLEKIDQGYDYVLGSRKIKGGSNPKGWGFKRLFFSEIGGLISRLILFFPSKLFFKITDPTTGLRASRVNGFLDQLDMDNLYSKQFAYKMQFLYQMVKLGAKITEIPLNFQLRQNGESKITSMTAFDSLRTVILVRWHDQATQKFIKFGIVGFIGYLVNAFGLELFARLVAKQWLVWLLGTEMAIISNFILNNLWTFNEEKFARISKFLAKFLQFNFTSGGALLIQTAAGTLLGHLFGFEYRQLFLPLIIATLIVPYNWFMYNKVIWKK